MASPKTSDGKPIVLASLFPGGVLYYVTGAGDGASTRGDGEVFGLQVSGTSPSDPDPVEFDFCDWVYMSGGSLRWDNAVFGDYVSLELIIPATPAPTSTPGAGNCNLVTGPYGASTLIVPAAGNGSHTVDLDTAIPIPASDEVLGTANGFWEWSNPDTGHGSVTAGTPGAAQWHLMTVEVIGARFLNRLMLLGTGREDIDPPIKPKKILPHWKFRVTVHSAGRPSGTLDLVWTTKGGRVRTS